MIKSLRRKFILIAMLSLAATLLVLGGAINIGNAALETRRVDAAIELLSKNSGRFPTWEDTSSGDGIKDHIGYGGGFELTKETEFETRYLVATVAAGTITSMNTEHIAALDAQNAGELISDILEGGEQKGYLYDYRYGVFSNSDDSLTVILIDCFLQRTNDENIFWMTILLALLCMTLVFVLLLILSRRMLRPFVYNLERQRRFVTDASHELKTPLAVISANTGVLQLEMGEDNKWLSSTAAQVERLNGLIRDLIELAKSDEVAANEAQSDVPFGTLLEQNTETYAAEAREKGLMLEREIAPEVVVRGNQESLVRLITLLLDNAVKYCDDGGTITVQLHAKGKGAVMEIANTAKNIDPAEIPRYFDRFYRADPSRSRATGGNGIGLSTARGIAEQHHGRLDAHWENGVITFRAVI